MSSEIDGLLVNGYFDDRFAQSVGVFARHILSGQDVGASFALSIEGEMAVDVWAGAHDESGKVLWREDTLINVYSSTKTVAFLCALVAADRGLIDFDAPVCDYWPEFKSSGKDGVLVWHLMNHAAGLPGLDRSVTLEEMCDWNTITGMLAAQAPWWEPGSAIGYHAMTQGYLIGEVLRRATGVPLGQFLREEIAGPLEADFYIGVPKSEFHRICNLIPPEGGPPVAEEGTIAARTFASPAPRAEDSWTDIWRQAELPAVNGHGNARSLVRLQTPLACGGSAFGVDLMSEKTARSVMRERIRGVDQVLGAPMAFGLGFGLSRDPVRLAPNDNSCFWGGWGGSIVLIDQDERLAMSFVMNKMSSGTLGDLRALNLSKQVYRDLG